MDNRQADSQVTHSLPAMFAYGLTRRDAPCPSFYIFSYHLHNRINGTHLFLLASAIACGHSKARTSKPAALTPQNPQQINVYAL